MATKKTKPVAKKTVTRKPAKKAVIKKGISKPTRTIKVYEQPTSTPSERTILTRLNSLHTNLLALRSDFEAFVQLVEGQIAHQKELFPKWEKLLNQINIANQPPAERLQPVDNGRERE